MSLFKFRTEETPDWSYDELTVDDSDQTPGALYIECADRSEAFAVDLPREQVEKLYAVLGMWLRP